MRYFRQVNGTKRTVLAVSILPQIALVKWLGSHPDWIETYYSEGLYPYISQFLRMLFGWIPFSVGDLFYTVLFFAAFRYLYLHGKRLWKRPKQFLVDFGIVLSLAYFIFHLFWGLNYYRLPLEEKFGIQKEYTITDLEEFTDYLIQKTNKIQFQITQDTSLAVQLPYTRNEIFQKTIGVYAQVQSNHPSFGYPIPSLKKSIYSLPLTYMGYGGYINPFTGEAQVNGEIPILRYPTVSAHEIGHQTGYSSESATNFIGFWITSQSKDPHFKYAAYSHALAYCLSDLRAKDTETFKVLWDTVNPGIKKNYEELRRFWHAYENPTEPLFKSIFNAFLKANSQAEGIQSYNRVVGLLVNYHQRYGF
ncbi:MAG: DUF3810 domain-containing protein [Bacteroidota bacterium]